MEAFLPGYSLFHKCMRHVFNLDISTLSLIILPWLIFLLSKLLRSIFPYLTSTFVLDINDPDSRRVLRWMTERGLMENTPTLRVKSRYEGQKDHEVETNKSGFVNLRKTLVHLPLSFEPGDQMCRFWHRRRPFSIQRVVESYSWSTDVSLSISVLGRSLQPLVDFLTEVRDWSLVEEGQKVRIMRPKAKKKRNPFGDNPWRCAANKQIRPIKTVMLPEEKKSSLLDSINYFLRPQTRKWYTARGIPYRRGYLFFGPSGTGKTSMALSCAGLFGLDIYVVSLNDPSITEDDLEQLLIETPEYCIILFEDVDCAGLGRKISTASAEPEAFSSINGISLSALLNAIDGVLSTEGRILFMTTNHRERLDQALIRPGRVDFFLQFTLATRETARDFFLLMFPDVCSENADLAKQFADAIPENAVSPAKIQEYLLEWKNNPQQAALHGSCSLHYSRSSGRSFQL